MQANSSQLLHFKYVRSESRWIIRGCTFVEKQEGRAGFSPPLAGC